MDFSVFFNHVFFKHVYPILNITQSLHVSPGHQKGFLLEQPLWRSFDFFFPLNMTLTPTFVPWSVSLQPLSKRGAWLAPEGRRQRTTRWGSSVHTGGLTPFLRSESLLTCTGAASLSDLCLIPSASVFSSRRPDRCGIFHIQKVFTRQRFRF